MCGGNIRAEVSLSVSSSRSNSALAAIRGENGMYGLIHGRNRGVARAPQGPMKRPDGDVVWGSGLGMPDKHARAIPQLEAFKKVLAL